MLINFVSFLLAYVLMIAENQRFEMISSQKAGFRRNQSTENHLLHLLSDFYGAMDHGQIAILALFDVSSAFDYVYHPILLQRLSISFGLVDQHLEWLCSFWSERANCVAVGTSSTPWVPANFAIPQLSVSLLSLRGLLYQLYVDDAGL